VSVNQLVSKAQQDKHAATLIPWADSKAALKVKNVPPQEILKPSPKPLILLGTCANFFEIGPQSVEHGDMAQSIAWAYAAGFDQHIVKPIVCDLFLEELQQAGRRVELALTG
jgi:hypothetical protein